LSLWHVRGTVGRRARSVALARERRPGIGADAYYVLRPSARISRRSRVDPERLATMAGVAANDSRHVRFSGRLRPFHVSRWSLLRSLLRSGDRVVRWNGEPITRHREYPAA